VRILQLCHKPPFPANDGGKIAMATMAESLKQNGCDIYQLILETPTHPVHANHTNPFPHTVVFVDTRVRLAAALFNLFFSKKSYNIARFISSSWQNAIHKAIHEFKPDIIQAEGIWTIAGIEHFKTNKTPLVLRAHNAEFKIWERKSSLSKGIKKWYLNILSKRLKADELSIIEHCQGLICISKTDEDLLVKNLAIPAISVSGGTELIHAEAKHYKQTDSLQLFHLGAMNWGPNKEGIDFFLKDIWPKLRLHFSDLNLVLGGRNLPQAYKQLESQGIICEDVDSAELFMKANGIMIVPLKSGSGIRIKIMEGLALGIVILCSKIAAEGIPVTSGKELFFCENASDYIATLQNIKDNPLRLREISENARTFARIHFDQSEAGKRVITFYKSIHRI